MFQKWINAYVKSYDGGTKWMYFSIEDEELWKKLMIFGKQKKTIFLRNLSKITNMNRFCIIRKSGKFLQAVAKKTILNQNLFKKGLSSQLIV